MKLATQGLGEGRVGIQTLVPAFLLGHPPVQFSGVGWGDKWQHREVEPRLSGTQHSHVSNGLAKGALSTEESTGNGLTCNIQNWPLARQEGDWA